MSRFKRGLRFLLVASLVGVSSDIAHGQCQYEVTVLGSVDRPEPYSVNDSGSVVGVLLDFPTDFDAFLWLGEGPVVRLPMPSGNHSIAYDINEAGVVVGYYTSEQGDRGFIWDGSETRTLGVLPGHNRSEARAVNEGGIIVGFSIGAQRPVAWVDEKIQDLSPLLGVEGGRANDVNDRNEVVGRCRHPNPPVERAFFLELDTGKAIDIGVIPQGEDGEAVAVNNRGQVVVCGDDSKTGEQRSFVWASGHMIDLGLLPGDTETVGTDINDRGLVVGGSRGDDGVWVPFVWHRGQLTDLNDLISSEGVSLQHSSAFGISNAGFIVSMAKRDTGETIGVLLSPIDAPAGDVTGDCRVGFDDVLTLLTEWGPCKYCIADTDGNGTVDFRDLLIVLTSWG